MALQGWARTDGEGRFEFLTVRPAPDHLGREKAHIHITLESQEFGRQWAPTVILPDHPVEIDNVQQIAVSIRLRQKADF
jgi:protocatechuate 3,4-dioxygenase, beta subunit